MPSHKNRVQMTTATTGTGTITLGSASSGYQTFAAAYGGNATVDILIVDGTAWEVARNCTYTNVGTTVTRGTLEASSTGSAISLSGSAVVSVIARAEWGNEIETARQRYISGLVVTKNAGGNTLDISAGSCYDPSSQRVITYAGATGVNAGTLGASQWNQVYIYDNAGTATIEVVNNAAAPSTTYAGTARQGGTNSNRRWIGSFLTDGSSNIRNMLAYERGHGIIEVWGGGLAVLSGGTSSTYAAVSLATVVPRYVAFEALLDIGRTFSTTAAHDVQLQLSPDQTNDTWRDRVYVYSTSSSPRLQPWVSIDASTPQIYYKISASGGSGQNCGMTCLGYRAAR
jgi:hypothetical protein